MDFYESLHSYNWDETKDEIYSKGANDVLRALEKDRLNLDDFKALISPAASPYLEEMAQQSRMKTLRRFGKTIQMLLLIHI